MTKLRETSVAVVIALVLPRQANAQQLLTGNDLYKQCQSSPATPAYGQCVGYIKGSIRITGVSHRSDRKSMISSSNIFAIIPPIAILVPTDSFPSH